MYKSYEQRTTDVLSECSAVHAAESKPPAGTSLDEVEFVSLQLFSTQEIIVQPLKSTHDIVTTAQEDFAIDS